MALPVEINPLQLKTSGGYSVSKSLRFRSSATAYLNRTFTTPTNNKIWTWSGWVKRGTLSSGPFCIAGAGTGASAYIRLETNDTLNIFDYTGSAYIWQLNTTQVFRDPSAWYHIVIAVDTTQATAANRVKLYVNGAQVTVFGTASYPTQNTNTYFNSAVATYIGAGTNGSAYQFLDGYLAEVYFIDGQALTPSSFGAYDTNGVWQPLRYSGTYGTNGFYLPFSNTTSTTTLVADSSGNGNNWTPNNISLTAGTTYDSMLDSPTVTSASVANYCVLNPLDIGSLAPSNGNLWMVQPATTHTGVRGTFKMPTTGKWYFEAINLKDQTPGTISSYIGLATAAAAMNTYAYNTTGTYGLYGANTGNGIVTNGSLGANSITPFPANAVLQLAYDAGAGNLWLGVNNVWYNSTAGTTGNPSAGTNPTITVASSLGLFPHLELFNNSLYANFGQQPFTYTPPTGFNALNTYNLPTPTIANGAQYMAATTYTGTGASLTINNGTNTTIGTTFQPDLVWMKSRSAATDHALFDVVRGTTLELISDSTAAETTQATGLTAFGSTGFTIGAEAKLNTSTATYVGWQWKANGTGVSNTNGSITSTVSANTTAGFSVVTYTGTGASNATVGHGLGVVPNMVIVKARGAASDGTWRVKHSSLSSNNNVALNLTDAQFNVTTSANGGVGDLSSSTTFTLANGTGSNSNVNQSTITYVAYCWAAVPGYSAFGSLTGNSSTDGPFVYCGFRPRFVLFKRADSLGDWDIWDTSRNTYNVIGEELYANSSAAGTTFTDLDILSNGFKMRANTGTGTFIYAAFAENPFQSSRAR